MRSLNRLALSATTHCLTGCAIGEVLGMVLGAAFHWSNSTTIVVSVVLAFLFGYGLTVRPLLASGLGTPVVLRLALASERHPSLSLVAVVAAFPVNRWLIARGQGHAVLHAHRGHGHHH
jgi:hypothetical protein